MLAKGKLKYVSFFPELTNNGNEARTTTICHKL
jgi:hypothetical protein